jgi:hypothetical protein
VRPGKAACSSEHGTGSGSGTGSGLVIQHVIAVSLVSQAIGDRPPGNRGQGNRGQGNRGQTKAIGDRPRFPP